MMNSIQSVANAIVRIQFTGLNGRRSHVFYERLARLGHLYKARLFGGTGFSQISKFASIKFREGKAALEVALSKGAARTSVLHFFSVIF